MNSSLLKAICHFAKIAEQIALSQPRKIVRVKEDGSCCSVAEMRIAEEAISFFSSVDSNLLVLTEETAHSQSERFDSGVSVVIDNIDGTRCYLEHASDWTISIGVLVNGYPLLGVVTDPVRGEKLYTDGATVYLQLDEKVSRLKSSQVNLENIARLESEDSASIFWWNQSVSSVPMARATGRALMNVATGKAHGLALRNHLWDVAGAWKALELLNIHLYDGERQIRKVSSCGFDEDLYMKRLLYFSPLETAKLISQNLYCSPG